MNFTIEDKAPQPYAAIRRTLSMEGGEFAAALPECWPQVWAWIDGQGMEPTGRPFIRYLEISMPDALMVDIGIPIPEEVSGSGDIIVETFPAGRYVAGSFFGHFDGLVDANAELQGWAKDTGLNLAGGDVGGKEVWASRTEFYVTDPATEPDPAKWQTDLCYLLQD